jgi:hypothetical protein
MVMLPDLPKARYQVWVRGYGLVDSPKVAAESGTTLNLTAVIAPDRAAAAEYYPAIYWWSMLKIPAAEDFPGTGPNGNGFPVVGPMARRYQDQWLRQLPGELPGTSPSRPSGIERANAELAAHDLVP